MNKIFYAAFLAGTFFANKADAQACDWKQDTPNAKIVIELPSGQKLEPEDSADQETLTLGLWSPMDAFGSSVKIASIREGLFMTQGPDDSNGIMSD